MNRNEYNINDHDVKVERMYEKSGEFQTEDGRNIKYKNYYAVISIDGAQVITKVEKGFGEIVEMQFDQPF